MDKFNLQKLNLSFSLYRRLVLGISALWVLGMANSLAGFTWFLLTDEPASQPALAAPMVDTRPKAQVSHYALDQWHLFGKVEKNVPRPKPKQQVEAPKTKLNLTLLGVFTASDQSRSSAIIGKAGGRDAQYFLTGDRVHGAALLSAVYDDRVILDNRGKLETLKFAELAKVAGFAANTTKTKKAKPNAKTRTKNTVKLTERTGPNAIEEELLKARSVEQFMDVARDHLEANPEEALRSVGLEPAGNGYRVSKQANMLLGLGMQPGDLITSINGLQVGNVEQDQSLLQDMVVSGQTLKVEIQRGKRKFIVNHTVP